MVVSRTPAEEADIRSSLPLNSQDTPQSPPDKSEGTQIPGDGHQGQAFSSQDFHWDPEQGTDNCSRQHQMLRVSCLLAINCCCLQRPPQESLTESSHTYTHRKSPRSNNSSCLTDTQSPMVFARQNSRRKSSLINQAPAVKGRTRREAVYSQPPLVQRAECAASQP